MCLRLHDMEDPNRISVRRPRLELPRRMIRRDLVQLGLVVAVQVAASKQFPVFSKQRTVNRPQPANQLTSF